MAKIVQIFILLTILSVCQADGSTKICTEATKATLESKRDVKFLLVLMRHGSRAVNRDSIWNSYFKTFKKEEYGLLNDVGRNQALLGGQNLHMQYPKFLKKLLVKHIKVEAKDIERTIDTAKGFADGLIINFRTLKEEKLTNLNSFPPIHIEHNMENICFKVSLTKHLIYHLENKSTQDKTNPEWNVEKTDVDGKSHWEDHTDNMCLMQKKIRENFIEHEAKIMDSKTVKAIKKILKTKPQFIKMFKSEKITISSLKWKEISQLCDYCWNVDFLQKKDSCGKEMMKLVKIVYLFKFYGINNQKGDDIYASVLGNKYADILSSSILKQKNSNGPKIHIMGKSDSIISPFYKFLGIIPKRQPYLDMMQEAISIKKAKLPLNPQFADTLVTEISKKGDKYFVRLIRNGRSIKIAACNKLECELSSFIKFTKAKALSLPDIKKRCQITPKQTLQKKI